ncbi:ABC transporter ATP-binding protein [Geomesophilobacter sediminis]|uniref:ABC transporter ATP-binding protein n=1 Tax=Geomesophilobacter sediminis TaxID=2798584 RepID=A0A8J7JAH4_9BACT|nr:ABC transporter ATP-binding protein [Geomesophilobacter sediminis]MBJ6723353.1 ABC transporter ATP-binding protein [Geomesophilobacter sediminis]
MIETVGITKTYNQGKPNEYRALREVSVTVEAGEFVVIKGPSGSGKTTLLTLVGGMARPTSGRIFVSGREISSLPERFLTEIRRQSFGFVFQSLNLIRGLSALENVMAPAYPSGEPHTRLRRRALELLERFGLAGRAGAKVEWLSGGEAQRVAIARALVNDPAAIIADEPTAHLDGALAAEFLDLLAQLNLQGKTVLVTSHDPRVWTGRAVSRVIELRDGAVVSADGTP